MLFTNNCFISFILSVFSLKGSDALRKSDGHLCNHLSMGGNNLSESQKVNTKIRFFSEKKEKGNLKKRSVWGGQSFFQLFYIICEHGQMRSLFGNIDEVYRSKIECQNQMFMGP